MSESETTLSEEEIRAAETQETETAPEPSESDSVDSEADVTEEELGAISASRDLEALLALSDDLSQEDKESFVDCCRIVFDKEFKSTDDQTAGDVDREFAYFLANTKRLCQVRNILAEELVGGKPSNEENWVITALSVFISNEMPIQNIPENAPPELVAEASQNINPDTVKQILGMLNMKFGELPDNQFAALDQEENVVIVDPSSTLARGYDALLITYQILGAQAGPEIDEGQEDEDSEMSLGHEMIKWFKEKGIYEEDLNCFRYFKHQEAFALARLVRELSANPQEGKVPPALDAEYRAMIDFVRKNPDKDWKISETVAKAYLSNLSKFRDKWALIEKTGIDMNVLPLDGSYDYDSDGPEGGNSTSTETPSGSSNLEKGGNNGLVKGERAGGLKIEGPKNIKEAIFNIFVQADVEFGMNFNPVAQLAGIAA